MFFFLVYAKWKSKEKLTNKNKRAKLFAAPKSKILLTATLCFEKSTWPCCSMPSAGALRSKNSLIRVPGPFFFTTLISPPILLTCMSEGKIMQFIIFLQLIMKDKKLSLFLRISSFLSTRFQYDVISHVQWCCNGIWISVRRHLTYQGSHNA